METKVKCNNGTFVGKKTDELIIWKGIPYATQPVGNLRWKRLFLPQTMTACMKP